jgi:hypothetical protein
VDLNGFVADGNRLQWKANKRKLNGKNQSFRYLSLVDPLVVFILFFGF